MVREKFNLPHFSHTCLADYYHRNGVSYRKPNFSYAFKTRQEEDIQKRQQEFARVLIGRLQNDDSEVLYIDESTFNLWQRPNRCWIAKGMTLSLPDKRSPSLTVIGALSSQRGFLYHKILTSTNNQRLFSAFIANLKMRCLSHTVVVMDNLAIHRTKMVQQLFDDSFEILFLPPHSCALNPIEHLWNVAKQQWRKYVLETAITEYDCNEVRLREVKEHLENILGKN